MGQGLLCQTLPDDFPNHLASPRPFRQAVPLSIHLMAGIVLACLAPRLLAAWWVPSITPDGAYYVEQARALQRGNLGEGLKGLSVYPAILAAINRSGVEWELAATIWGLVMSSLVVLPLYGWVRRQFDDRIALAACFLYIVHPKFIEMSPETIRDSTFWFLFASSLYWQWRAVVEVRLAWFALAGGATALACLTRFEGLYLFLPLGLWSSWRYRALRESRTTLAVGVALFAAVLPGLVLTANLLWNQTHGNWLLPRLDPAARAVVWVKGLTGRLVGLADAPTGIGGSISLGRMLWVFFPVMTRGLSPCFALLMFGGLWKWRRVWGRHDHQVLFVTALAFVLSSWIQLWYDRQLCFRYALPIVLMAAPFAALGLLGLTLWFVAAASKILSAITRTVSLAAERSVAPGRFLRLLAWGPTAFVAVAGLVSAWLGLHQAFPHRMAAGSLGKWLQGSCGDEAVFVGPAGVTAVAAYYANARWEVFRRDVENAAEVVSLVKQLQPQVVLLEATRYLGRDQCRGIVECLKAQGWAPLRLPPDMKNCGELCVLMRNGGQRAQASPQAASDLRNNLQQSDRPSFARETASGVPEQYKR